jgi:ribonuclease G
VNELVVSKSDDGLSIAILNDKRVVELHHERFADEFAVGDVVLAKVKRITHGLNAAFVDIGHERDAFLHYFDLGPQIQSFQAHIRIARAGRLGKQQNLDQAQILPDIIKTGKMEDVLKPGQEVLVQVVKEPISTKGPRLSSEVSIPGQYVVLVPFGTTVSVSKKLKSGDERRRLKTVVEKYKPRNFSVIVRTAAEGKDEAAIKADIEGILEKWNEMMEALPNAKPPARVLSEQNRATSILRDMLSIGFDSIYTDDKAAYDSILAYLQVQQPDQVKNLKMYRNRVPILQAMGIDKQIKASFGKIVTMDNGSYLVIEHTEAMHVVDVNSGSKNLKNQTLEETAVKVNVMAAREVARQMRLRDLGGIVVIDFIDMKKLENRKLLMNELFDAMKDDRAKHAILPLSKFGLVQITRQRVRPQLDIVVTEDCPTCGGTGKMQPSILIADEVQNNVDYIINQNNEKKLSIQVNPYVGAFLRQGGLFRSPQWRWFRKYGKWVRINDDTSLPINGARYFNGSGEEIKL